jgi:hypothetical protein
VRLGSLLLAEDKSFGNPVRRADKRRFPGAKPPLQIASQRDAQARLPRSNHTSTPRDSQGRSIKTVSQINGVHRYEQP